MFNNNNPISLPHNLQYIIKISHSLLPKISKKYPQIYYHNAEALRCQTIILFAQWHSHFRRKFDIIFFKEIFYISIDFGTRNHNSLMWA